jgi:hypothetical protein
MEFFMSGRNDQEQLFDLMEQIERAWMESGDYTLVDRLAAQHPAVAENLYLFFATVVDAPDELDRSRPELAEQTKRIREWLHEGGGFAIVAAAAAGETESTETASSVSGETTPQSSSTPPPTFFGLLKKAGDAPDPEAMANRLDVSVDFLREVSKHTDLLPTGVRRELARRVERHFFIDASLVLTSLGEGRMHGGGPLARAASRVGGQVFERRALTYEELVKRSSMDESHQRFWLSLAES